MGLMGTDVDNELVGDVVCWNERVFVDERRERAAIVVGSNGDETALFLCFSQNGLVEAKS